MKIKASSNSIYQNGLKSLFSNQPLVSKLINSQQSNQSPSVSSSQYNRNPDLNGHYHYVNHQLTRSMRNSSNSVDYLTEQQQQQQLPTSSNLSSISNTSSFISTPSIFTQSDELNHHNHNQHQISEVIKCTYTNEINKDELPRPNFVSSVKNLFEKQIHTVNGEANKLTENINITNNANSLKSHHHHHHLHSSSNAVSMSSSSSSLTKSNLLNRLSNGGHIEPTQPPPPPPPLPTSIIESNLNIPVSPSSSSSLSGSSTTSSPSSATSTANSSASSSPPSYLKAENLVDILKQNGTLVYEHSQAEFSANISASIEQHRKRSINTFKHI